MCIRDSFYAIYFQIVYYSSFSRILFGKYESVKTLFSGTDSYGESSFDGLQASNKAKFSDNKIAWKFFFRYDLGSGQYSDC